MNLVPVDINQGLDAYADPGVFVIECLERGKSWLSDALSKGDLDALFNTRGAAETLRVATIQKQLGTDSVLAATELVRRAERAIGLGIRKGQEEGTVARHGDAARTKTDQNGFGSEQEKRSPSDFAKPGELYPPGNGRQAGIFDLAVGVTDEEFERAIEEAKEEGNLTRANLGRKLKKLPRRPKRPEVLRGHRHIDIHRVIDKTIAFSGFEQSLWDVIDTPEQWQSLDPENVSQWLVDLDEALRSLNKLRRKLREL